MKNMLLYNYGSGFTISLDSGSTISTKLQFLIIIIKNTKDDVKVLLPSQYIDGVIKLDLEIDEKQLYSFNNKEVELFARSHVGTILNGY